MSVEITRRIEFDAGHRIPDHKSKCRNVHGHRYVLEVTLRDDIKNIPGRSDDGMIVDFGDLKSVMVDLIGEPWDHAFLICEADPFASKFLSLGDDHKTVWLDFVPTVENLVNYAANVLRGRYGFVLSHVRLYETPNCWADWYKEEGDRK